MNVNLVFIAVILILAFYAFRGFRKGLINVIFSLVAIICTLSLVSVVTPYVSDFLTEKTEWYDGIYEKCEAGVEQVIAAGVDASTENQKAALENCGIALPKNAENRLVEGAGTVLNEVLESSGIYALLGENLAKFIFRTLVFVIAFVLIYLIIFLFFRLLNKIFKLPGLNVVNKGAGLFVGLFKGLLVVWFLFLIVSAISSTAAGRVLYESIQENEVTAALYNGNILIYLVMAFI